METPEKKSSGGDLDVIVARMLINSPGRGALDHELRQREIQDEYRLHELSLETSKGDTTVFIGFSDIPPHVACNGSYWRSKVFRVDSEKLLRTGSAVFAKLLSPEQQARFRRRLLTTTSTAIATTPPVRTTTKFVLDLTPPTEGDEVADVLASLSLPRSVRDWWMAEDRLGVSRYSVSGHDDHCPMHAEVDIECPKTDECQTVLDRIREEELWGNSRAPEYHADGAMRYIMDLADILPSPSRAIADYCPVRHRVNIIRLLLAIQGEELVLNSAPRVWTLVGIANSLNCTGVLRDSVFSWLVAQPNSHFIELNPEAALQMAWSLQISDVTRVTMRILVAERAIEALGSESRFESTRASSQKRHTIFGRPREDLPDEIENILEHATRSLVKRVRATYADLDPSCNGAVGWSEFPILRTVRQCIDQSSSTDRQEDFALDIEHLADYMRALISLPARVHPEDKRCESYDEDRRCYVPRDSFVPTAKIYNELSPAQMLLTPVFWINLLNQINNQLDYPATYFRTTKLGQTLERLNSTVAAAQGMGMIWSWEHPPQSLFSPVEVFPTQLCAVIRLLAERWTHCDLEVPLLRTRHLSLCLSESEFKYLPRWAGGEKDGSGEVFQQEDLLVPGPNDVLVAGNKDGSGTDLAAARTTAEGSVVAAAPTNDDKIALRTALTQEKAEPPEDMEIWRDYVDPDVDDADGNEDNNIDNMVWWIVGDEDNDVHHDHDLDDL